jgi:hypothetical protein
MWRTRLLDGVHFLESSVGDAITRLLLGSQQVIQKCRQLGLWVTINDFEAGWVGRTGWLTFARIR